MSHSAKVTFGGVLVQLLVSILRIVGFLVGWACKVIGFVFETVSHFTFKLVGK
jgi:hypothetical protein